MMKGHDEWEKLSLSRAFLVFMSLQRFRKIDQSIVKLCFDHFVERIN